MTVLIYLTTGQRLTKFNQTLVISSWFFSSYSGGREQTTAQFGTGRGDTMREDTTPLVLPLPNSTPSTRAHTGETPDENRHSFKLLEI